LPLELQFATTGEGDDDIQEARQGPLGQMIEAHTRSCEIDLVKSRLGEKLPKGSYYKYIGFLIRKNTRIIEVDEATVEEETTKLKSKMVIGCFVGKKPSALEFEAWLVALNAELNGGSVVFSHFEGRGFFSLEADCKETQKKILTLPPQCNQ
jgi:hypothetical protein